MTTQHTSVDHILNSAIDRVLEQLNREKNIPIERRFKCTTEAKKELTKQVLILVRRLLVNAQDLLTASNQKTLDIDSFMSAFKLTFRTISEAPRLENPNKELLTSSSPRKPLPDTFSFFIERMIRTRLQIY
jgi:hypothetical protein